MKLFNSAKKQSQRQLSFKETNSFEERLAIRRKLEEKYPIDKFAMVVIEGLNQLDSNAKPFITMGIDYQFTLLRVLGYIRTKMVVNSKQDSYFVKVRSRIRQNTETMEQLHQRFADQDGFLYMEIRRENTF